jgi:hypothetical protein
MDEQPKRPSETDDTVNPTSAARGADETFGWTAEGDDKQAGSGTTAERMLAQLQSMIDSIATQAAPVVRQIGAKAAELAATAADRAGPIAHKAADATADASVKIAERSRVLAADLRRDSNGHGRTATAEPTTDIAAELRDDTASEEGDSSAAVKDVLDDATDLTSRDDPAEGSR